MQGTMGKGRKVEDMDIVLEELSIWLGSGEKKVHVSLVSQLCPTLSDHMNCSLPGSSIQGIS